MGKKTEALTKLQFAFVAAFEGDGTEAASKAGAKNPKEYAHATMKLPAVKKAIAAKQAAALKAAGKELGKRLAKCDITESILEDIAFLKSVYRNFSDKKQKRADEANTAVRAAEASVKAGMGLAELQGFIWNKNLNIGRLFEGKTEEELVYFAEHGYWPDGQPDESGTRESQSSSQGPSKPN